MPDEPDIADAPYRTGIALFNRGEFFEAHEVWEDVWNECASAERRFFQALIQAAVSAHHYARGNMTGANRLYHSGRKYMEPFGPVHRGLAVDPFWDALAAHLAGGPAPTIVTSSTPEAGVAPPAPR